MNTNTMKKVTLAVCMTSVFTLGACASSPQYSDTSRDSGDYRSGRVVNSEVRRARTCVSCGTVRSVTPVAERGRTSGAGAVLGAIIGGVAGHQVGGGRGQDIATVAGAVGGAVVGNKVEGNRRNDVVYDIRVEMESGTDRVITVSDAGGLRAGDQVLVDGNQITIVD